MSKKHIKKENIRQSKKILAPDETPVIKSTNDMHPAFCFKFCCHKGFTVKDHDKDAKALLADKLDQLSNVNWGAIQRAPRHGLGHEIIDQDSIAVPLPSNTPGDRKFLAFRLGGGKNAVFIGYRNQKVFYIVWIDKNGAVYKH